jgi:lysozyme
MIPLRQGFGGQVCDEALELIRRFEGLGDGDRAVPGLQPYLCPAGVWTIGYGATCSLDGQRVTRDTPALDEAQAAALLQRDVVRFAAAVDRLVRVPIHELQRGALTSFAFNLGAGALQCSTLLRRVNALEWDDVPSQFLRWVHADGRRLPGLVRRRAAEASLWQRGT